MDHILGLLSLRERSKLHLVCTRGIRRLLTHDFHLLKILQKYCSIQYSTFPFKINSIVISAFNLPGKKPLYAKMKKNDDDDDLVVGVKLTSIIDRDNDKTMKTLVYLPCLPTITEEVTQFVKDCDCLLVDGTFWSNQELISLGITKRNAIDMGHVTIDGKNGSLVWLRSLEIPKKIYVHINNTNPILMKTSPERKMVDEARIEIGYDGMDILI